jgi:hypothetical protein
MRTVVLQLRCCYLCTATGAEATGALMGAPPPDLPALEPALTPEFILPPDLEPIDPDEYEGGAGDPR